MFGEIDGRTMHVFSENMTLYNLPAASSVADPGCLSRIPDPKTAIKERGGKKLVVITFFVAINFTKL